MGNSTSTVEPNDLSEAPVLLEIPKAPELPDIPKKMSYVDVVKSSKRSIKIDKIIKSIDAEMAILYKKKKNEVEKTYRQTDRNKMKNRRRRRNKRNRCKKFVNPLKTSENQFDILNDQVVEDVLIHDTDAISCKFYEKHFNDTCKYIGYRHHHSDSDLDICLLSVENTLKTNVLTNLKFFHPIYQVLIYDVNGSRVFGDFYIETENNNNCSIQTKVDGYTGHFVDTNLSSIVPMPKSWINMINLPYIHINFSSLPKININGIHLNHGDEYTLKYLSYNYGIITKDKDAYLRYVH
jgi:hypothetical protein